MTDQHKTCGAIPRPPSDDELKRLAREVPKQGVNGTPHFFAGPGPGRIVQRLATPAQVTTSDGKTVVCPWEVRWRLDRAIGVDRATAVKQFMAVLTDAKGWIRAGVHWRQVKGSEPADVLVRVLPGDQTVCGRGAAGCFSTGRGLPAVECGVELIGRPGPWRAVVGMETAHAAYAVADMYFPQHQPYRGSLGTWPEMAAVNFYPTDEEVRACVEWLAGKTPPALIHED